MSAAPGSNILIVEDERDVIDLLSLNFRRAGGFNVSTAIDGVSGVVGFAGAERVTNSEPRLRNPMPRTSLECAQ
jgi:hypothetical protein